MKQPQIFFAVVPLAQHLCLVHIVSLLCLQDQNGCKQHVYGSQLQEKSLWLVACTANLSTQTLSPYVLGSKLELLLCNAAWLQIMAKQLRSKQLFQTSKHGFQQPLVYSNITVCVLLQQLCMI